MGSTKLILIALLIVFFSESVYAGEIQLLCLKKGEIVKFSQCNPAIEDRRCTSDLCQYCVSVSNQVFCPLSINECKQINKCTFLNGGSGDIGTTPGGTEIQTTVSLVSPLNNSSFNVGNVVSFVYDVAGSGNVRRCELLIGGIPRKSNSSAVASSGNILQFNFTRPGEYEWSIRCTDKDSKSITSSARLIQIIDLPERANQRISLVGPENGFSTSGPIEISFNYNVSNITRITGCSLIINGVSSGENKTTISTRRTNSILATLQPGFYEWFIVCSNRTKNYESERFSLTILSQEQNSSNSNGSNNGVGNNDNNSGESSSSSSSSSGSSVSGYGVSYGESGGRGGTGGGGSSTTLKTYDKDSFTNVSLTNSLEKNKTFLENNSNENLSSLFEKRTVQNVNQQKEIKAEGGITGSAVRNSSSIATGTWIAFTSTLILLVCATIALFFLKKKDFSKRAKRLN